MELIQVLFLIMRKASARIAVLRWRERCESSRKNPQDAGLDLSGCCWWHDSTMFHLWAVNFYQFSSSLRFTECPGWSRITWSPWSRLLLRRQSWWFCRQTMPNPSRASRFHRKFENPTWFGVYLSNVSDSPKRRSPIFATGPITRTIQRPLDLQVLTGQELFDQRPASVPAFAPWTLGGSWGWDPGILGFVSLEAQKENTSWTQLKTSKH